MNYFITLHMKINKKCRIKYHHLFKKKIRIERGIYLTNFQIFLKTNFYMKKLILYFAHIKLPSVDNSFVSNRKIVNFIYT